MCLLEQNLIFLVVIVFNLFTFPPRCRGKGRVAAGAAAAGGAEAGAEPHVHAAQHGAGGDTEPHG